MTAQNATQRCDRQVIIEDDHREDFIGLRCSCGWMNTIDRDYSCGWKAMRALARGTAYGHASTRPLILTIEFGY